MVFNSVICSPFINIPYIYAMITPKYDNGAYVDGLNLDIAKNLNKYPIKPINPFNASDIFIFLFAKFICLNNNPVNKREPGKYDRKI